MSSPPSASPPVIEAMVRAFERTYAGSVPFKEDGAITAELVEEAPPVLEALAELLAAPSREAPAHEAYALLTLLSHRAGLLGATPSAMLSMLDALLDALKVGSLTAAAGLRDQLWMVVVEGYSAGRDERVTRQLRQASARNQVSLALAPGCWVAFLGGRLDVEAVEAILAELARELLRSDARACLLDVTRLECDVVEPFARALAGFAMTAASVGTELFLVAREGELHAGLAASSAGAASVTLGTDVQAALSACLAAAGIELKARGRSWAKGLFEKSR